MGLFSSIGDFVSGALGSVSKIPIIGDLVGGLAGSAGSIIGGERANSASLGSTREQMSFQERMSSTAYQRAMDDMKKAGLNPILAYKQGGASSPTGSSMTFQNTAAGLGQAIDQFQNSALSRKSAQASIDQVRAQTYKTRSEAELLDLQKDRLKLENSLKDYDLKLAPLKTSSAQEQLVRSIAKNKTLNKAALPALDNAQNFMDWFSEIFKSNFTNAMDHYLKGK